MRNISISIRMLKLLSILNIKNKEQTMHEKQYGEMGTHHDMGKKWMMKEMDVGAAGR